MNFDLPEIYAPLIEPYRYKVLYGGRAAARSWTLSTLALLRGAEEPLRILCTRELQKSIKQSVHKLLSDQIHRLGLQGFYEIQQQGIYGKNGTEFMFLGVKANPEEIRSTEGIDICWIEEGHSLSERSLDIIDPTIRKEGSEIWVSLNTRFKFDHVFDKFVTNTMPDSLVIKSTYADNPWFPDVLRQQMEHMKATDYEKYLHIWLGELKLLSEGAVFGKQVKAVRRDGRLTSIPVATNVPVSTFWDVGKSDNTVIWFMQKVGKEYRFIDCYYARQEDLEHYARVIKKLDYNYDRHYLPHDAANDTLAAKKNVKEQLMEMGIKPITIVPRTKQKQSAIRLAERMFAECWFHQGTDDRGKRMDKGWEALCNYRYKYVDEKDRYQDEPFHDWASDFADAFMQFGQSYVNSDEVYTQPIIMNSSFKIF